VLALLVGGGSVDTLKSIYAAPQDVIDLADCYFYHTTDIPGHGVARGPWDLRGGESKYIGGVDLAGKRVLELGTSSGFMCRYMEQAGAEVVAYDLYEDLRSDLVPYHGEDSESLAKTDKDYIRRANNAWWFCHSIFHSNARMVNGDVYNVPEGIGEVDVATFGSVLLHVRDPFLALEASLKLVRGMVIVTEVTAPFSFPRLHSVSNRLVPRVLTRPAQLFAPDFMTREPKNRWWTLSPELVVRMIGVLGFGSSRVSYHHQRGPRGRTSMFTVVGVRS
jgi:hypothetical protein